MGVFVKVTEELCESFFSLVKTREIGIYRDPCEAVVKYVQEGRGQHIIK